MTGRPNVAYLKDCDHCERPIAMIRTVWGAERPWRAYEAQDVPIADAHPLCRWAFSQSRAGVLHVDPTLPADDPTLPRRVLIPHHCGRGAGIGKTDEAVENMVQAWLRGEAPSSDRPKVRQSNLGFRRGFGKRP